VVAPVQLLAAELHVASDRDRERLVDREEPEELLGGSVEQVRLSSKSWAPSIE